jgi:hypothetical protein
LIPFYSPRRTLIPNGLKCRCHVGRLWRLPVDRGRSHRPGAGLPIIWPVRLLPCRR